MLDMDISFVYFFSVEVIVFIHFQYNGCIYFQILGEGWQYLNKAIFPDTNYLYQIMQSEIITFDTRKFILCPKCDRLQCMLIGVACYHTLKQLYEVLL